MTVEGYSFDGWPIHPDYQPVKLQRSHALINLPEAMRISRRNRVIDVVKRIFLKTRLN